MTILKYSVLKMGTLRIYNVDTSLPIFDLTESVQDTLLREQKQAPGLSLISCMTKSLHYTDFTDNDNGWVEDSTPQLSLSGFKARKSIPITAMYHKPDCKLIQVDCDVSHVDLLWMNLSDGNQLTFHSLPNCRTEVVLEDMHGWHYEICHQPLWLYYIKNHLDPHQPVSLGHSTVVWVRDPKGNYQYAIEYLRSYRSPKVTWAQQLFAKFFPRIQDSYYITDNLQRSAPRF